RDRDGGSRCEEHRQERERENREVGRSSNAYEHSVWRSGQCMDWTRERCKGLRAPSRVLLAFVVMRSRSYGPLLSACIFAVLWGVRPNAQRTADRFEVLITNARIVDGTGAPWYRGDLGIVGDQITAIGSLAGATAQIRIDATNLVAAPGFIDLLG